MTDRVAPPLAADPPAMPALSSRLLALGREAHAIGRHEAAYHALTAAMHAANDEGHVRCLAEIEREAEAQIAWIDRHVPSHRLATASARERGHAGVYALLVRQTGAHQTMLTRPALADRPSVGVDAAGTGR